MVPAESALQQGEPPLDLRGRLKKYRDQIEDRNARINMKKPFNAAIKYGEMVTAAICGYIDERNAEALWVLATEFAESSSGFPEDKSAERAMDFLNYLTMIIALVRWKATEFLDVAEGILTNIQEEVDLDNAREELQNQRLPEDLIVDAITSKELPQDGNERIAVMKEIMRHVDEAFLKWFITALQKEGGEVTLRTFMERSISFQDADYLVTHAVKHGPIMRQKSIQVIQPNNLNI